MASLARSDVNRHKRNASESKKEIARSGENKNTSAIKGPLRAELARAL